MDLEPSPYDLNDMVVLTVPASCVPAMVEGLRASGRPSDADRIEKSAHQWLDPYENAYREEFVAAARKEHGKDGECEIDDCAPISESSNDPPGQYVMAWVWVYESNLEGYIKTEEDDDE